MNDEEFYDTEIAPVLLELAEKCKARNVPFLAAVYFPHPDDATIMAHGRTAVPSTTPPIEWTLAEAAMKANGNIDALVMAFARSGRPHESAVLAALGVPAAGGS